MGQGCVAIRGNSSCGGNVGNNVLLSKGEIVSQIGFRHFKSFRHFRGSVEETERLENGTEVINQSNFLDLSVSYALSNRFSGNLTLPFVMHTRSSMYEHGGNPPNGKGERHTTHSNGFADMRVGISYLLFNPEKHNFNYALGLGIKWPTGSYNTMDIFYNQGPKRDEDIVRVVDQSIQPGDGGKGVTVDLQGIHPLSQSWSISSNLYYLFNYQGTNGVQIRNSTTEFSCPDQYAVRLGMNYSNLKGMGFYLGARIEGIPATDLLGSSEGYRRPGYALSSEPGISYSKNGISFYASVPIAIYRNRTQSYLDKQRTAQTGVYTHGDAAFADYLLNFGISYRFNRMHHDKMNLPDLGDNPVIIE